MDRRLSVSKLSNAVLRHLGHYADPTVNQELIDLYDHPELDLSFLVSFPRSGNGYVRFLMTNIVLAHRGYPLALAKPGPGVHEGSGKPTQYLNFPGDIAAVSIDDVVPNAHTFPIDWISTIAEELSIGTTRLAKTHCIVPAGTADFLYLFRSPLECCTSYFQLLGSARFPQLLEGMKSAKATDIFAHVIGHFLDLYITLGEHALDCMGTGQCQPLSLSRLEDNDAGQLCQWLARCGSDIPVDLVQDILSKHRKRSSFDRSMLDVWTDPMKKHLERANDVYARLENSA